MGPRERDRATPRSAPLPAGSHLVLDAGIRRPGPGLLVGGAPWRVLRLSPRADRLVDAWAAGRPVPDDASARALAGRLVDAGIATVRLVPGAAAEQARPAVTVVIPVRDRAGGLAATLAALDPRLDVLVVDDGSTRPDETVTAVAARPGTRVARRPVSGGPGAARNTGWSTATAEIVAFLDADCVPAPGWPANQLGHFSDPTVAAVAPRIRTVPDPAAPAWLRAYEEERSPLDLGPAGGTVRPRARVTYVPSAALLVRRAAVAAVGGFDEALDTTGEDVDLVWRLAAAGWRVRYDPGVAVSHPMRRDGGAWLRQRFGYGRAAAPLQARHGDAASPLVVSPWTAGAWALLAAGRPLAASAVAGGSAGALSRLVSGSRPGGLPAGESVRLALLGHLIGGRAVAEAVRRPWWPIALVAAVVSRRARRAVLAAMVLPPLLAWRRRRPEVPPAVWCALSAADDAAYGAGVWAGCWEARSWRCLLPAWTGRPSRIGAPADPATSAGGPARTAGDA